MAATVDPLLPLSLLEAVRNVDTPQGELEAEFVAELRNKRLGLSDTVHAQIRRYVDAVRKEQRPPHDEAVALAKLIGRRPDAEAVFRAAGRHLAKEAYLLLSPSTRGVIDVLPSLLARPIALRKARRLADRYFGARIRRVGNYVEMVVPESVTINSAPRGAGCAYYEAGLRELLRLLIGSAAGVEHVQCLSRGDQRCEWRAEWRSIHKQS
jgi:predicted hydrocarbon binding protein